MTIPKPSEMKKPILKNLAKSSRPVKIARITEFVVKHFKLSKKERTEQMPKGGKKLTAKMTASINWNEKIGVLNVRESWISSNPFAKILPAFSKL